MTFHIGDRVRHEVDGEGRIVFNNVADDGLLDGDGDLTVKFDDTRYDVWRKPYELTLISSIEGTPIDRKDIKVGDRIRVEQSYAESEDKGIFEGAVTMIYDYGSISTENFYFSDGGPYTFTLLKHAESDPKVEAAVQALVALGLTESQARDKVKEIA